MDSIIFDLDGTLWDTTEVVLVAWNQVLAKHTEIKNELTKEDLQGTMGLQVKEIGKKLFPYLEEEKQQKILKECCHIECHYLSQQGGKLYEKPRG